MLKEGQEKTQKVSPCPEEGGGGAKSFGPAMCYVGRAEKSM